MSCPQGQAQVFHPSGLQVNKTQRKHQKLLQKAIILFYRGDEVDYGTLPLPKIELDENVNPTQNDAKGFTGPNVRKSSCKELTWEDFLIAYATIPGFVANRNIYRGTWFIEILCLVFMEHSKNHSVRDMLDIVSQWLSNRESELSSKQSCSYEVRHLYKKIYFNPGFVVEKSEDNKHKVVKRPTQNEDSTVFFR